MDKLLYIHRVAKMLDCSRPMVYKLIYEGKLKAVRIGKRGLRISEASLERFIEENTIIPDEFNLTEVDNSFLKIGSHVVIPLDSTEYSELAGSLMIVVSVTSKGVYAKEKNQKGAGVFIPNGYFNIPKDINCEIHGN